jgi:hypothetical protein
MRYSLFLGGLGALYALLGIVVFLNPAASAETISLTPETSAGMLEFITVYGGLELSLGLWWIFTALHSKRLVAGLQLAFFLHLGLGLTRLVALFFWPSPDLWTLLSLSAEVVVAVSAGLLLRSLVRDGRLRPAHLSS